jgi:outer membrane protein OmpU
MNKFNKIGLSALAGSLVAMSAQAEISMTADASIALTKVNESAKTSYYQSDSIYFTYAGETDGGLNVTVKLEIDGDAEVSGTGMDNRSIAIGSDSLGTITYAGHGGDSVMGGWDDVTPNAYEEVYANVKTDAGVAATGAIGGQTGNDGVWRYDSPSFSGLQFHASYYAGVVTDNSVSSYSDMGISFAPEMVEGLSLGYAQGSYDQAADVLGIDVSTMWAKYAYGPVTVGYQVSDSDGPSATHDDDTTAIGISYAVSENLSVSYGEHSIDNGAWSGVDQEASGFSASYTMGGTTIKAMKNSVDNIGGSPTADENGYEIALSFAF